MNVNYYKSGNEVQDAMAVMAKWISQNRKIRVIYHTGNAVDADVERGVIRIPRVACASGITEDALMILRGRVYHEAGHVDESTAVSKANYPKSKAKFSIWNALEDVRMEAAVADKHVGARLVFDWSAEYYNKDIAGKVSKGEVNAPLWEAMVACMFQSRGKAALWTLTPKAKKYFDAAYDKFIGWRKCRNAADTLKLAEEIYKILDEVNKEDQKSEDQKDEEQKDKGKGKKDKSEKGESGDEGGESEDGDSEDSGDKDEGKKSKSKKSKKSDKSDEEDGESSGSAGDMDDEDGESDESEGGDESEAGEGNEDKAGDKSDESKDGDVDGDKDGEGDETSDEKSESSMDDEAGESGKGSEAGEGGDEKSDGSSEEAGQSKGESKGEGDEGEKEAGKVKGGESKYELKDEAIKGKGDERSLDEQADGVTMDESLNEGLEELFKDLDPSEQYLSDRSNDVHEVPAVTDEDKSEYKREREDIGAEVAGLKSALEQALRSMARVRKNPYLRQGKIDKKRLVAIAKGLSKDVFYRKQDGVELDVAVAITIDESGSMAGIVSETRKVAIAVCEALKAIGVPFEVTGFSTTQSWGGELNGLDRTNPILYKHYKTFEEQWDVVRSRIVNTSALKHNVDGEVVEYAAFRVAQRKERRKVILSLSDGLPMAGHGNEATMAKNLKRVCNGARKAGIEVYGFGIGTLAPKGLYGDKWFVGLDRSASMGVEFVKEFAKIVTEGKVRV